MALNLSGQVKVKVSHTSLQPCKPCAFDWMQAFCVVLCEEEESPTLTERSKLPAFMYLSLRISKKNEYNQNPTGKKHVKKD